MYVFAKKKNSDETKLKISKAKSKPIEVVNIKTNCKINFAIEQLPASN